MGTQGARLAGGLGSGGSAGCREPGLSVFCLLRAGPSGAARQRPRCGCERGPLLATLRLPMPHGRHVSHEAADLKGEGLCPWPLPEESSAVCGGQVPHLKLPVPGAGMMLGYPSHGQSLPVRVGTQGSMQVAWPPRSWSSREVRSPRTPRSPPARVFTGQGEEGSLSFPPLPTAQSYPTVRS